MHRAQRAFVEFVEAGEGEDQPIDIVRAFDDLGQGRFDRVVRIFTVQQANQQKKGFAPHLHQGLIPEQRFDLVELVGALDVSVLQIRGGQILEKTPVQNPEAATAFPRALIGQDPVSASKQLDRFVQTPSDILAGRAFDLQEIILEGGAKVRFRYQILRQSCFILGNETGGAAQHLLAVVG